VLTYSEHQSAERDCEAPLMDPDKLGKIDESMTDTVNLWLA